MTEIKKYGKYESWKHRNLEIWKFAIKKSKNLEEFLRNRWQFLKNL